MYVLLNCFRGSSYILPVMKRVVKFGPIQKFCLGNFAKLGQYLLVFIDPKIDLKGVNLVFVFTIIFERYCKFPNTGSCSFYRFDKFLRMKSFLTYIFGWTLDKLLSILQLAITS